MRRVLVPAIVLAMFASSLAAQPAADATYAGKVVDDKGQPLAGAKVNCYAAVPDAVARFTIQELGAATTGADGKFTFSPKALKAMAVIVTARKEALSWAWFDWSNRQPGEEATLMLGKPVGLSGVVVDEAGKAVAGATLRPLLECGSQDQPAHMVGVEPADWLIVKTDANGSFQFAGMPADSRAEFIVDAPGKGRLSTMGEGGPGLQYAAGQTDVKLSMKPEGKIEGVLSQKDGKPISGAVVFARGRGLAEEFMGHSATTDKDGKFAIAGLDEDEYNLRMGSPKGVPDFIAAKSGVDVESGKTVSGVKLEATAGGLLQVTVTDDKGRPVPGATVRLTPQTSPGAYSASGGTPTDDKGVTSFRAEPGAVRVSAYARGFKYGSTSEESISIEDGKTAQTKIELTPLPAIQGIVRDADGKAVEGASVVAIGQNFMGHSTSRTDANGRFDLSYETYGGPDSKTEIKLVVRHPGRALAAAVDIQEPNKPLEITLKPGATLKGLVVDEEGKPLAKVKVVYSGAGASHSFGPSGAGADATTDEQGNYQIKGLPPGVYSVEVSAAGFGKGVARAEAAEGKADVEVEKIALQAAKMSITGVVTDPNAQPVAGATVLARGEGQPDHGVVRTDKSGKFTIDKLVEGKVRLRVSGGKGLGGSAEAQAGDKDVEIIVQPPDLDRSISGPRRGPRPTSRPKPQGEDF